VVWQAAVELCDRRNGRWQPFQQYKAHYTSSLYPCYFSVQHNWLQANKKQAALQLQIFNDGTEYDSYQVYITPGTYHIHTDILAAGKSTRLQIMPDQIKPSAGMVKITVVSNTNPAFKRTIQLDEGP
jgi:hypothetical protein